jgi:glucose/arabinose dehydrogenase
VIRYGPRMRRPGFSTLVLLLAAVVLAVPSTASALRLARLAGGFDSPVHVTSSPRDKKLYVVEQEGQIWRIGGGHRRLFLDIRRLVSYGGERGLFSIAFPPDYRQSRFFYVNYTDNGGDVHVARFRANDSFNRGRRKTRRMLLDVEHSTFGNHNGGQVVFGPNGRLYVSVGDGGSSCDPGGNAQDLDSRKGKLLSINTNMLGEGWRIDGYGLRNTWRFSFDSSTGRLYAADVGQGAWEEINSLPASRLGGAPENYEWDVREGRAPSGCAHGGLNGTGDRVSPKKVYSHSLGCSVTGGHVYRGRMLPSRLRGWYFYGDYCSGRIWRLRVNDAGELVRGARLVANTSLSVSSFGERRNGELLVVSRGGAVYRITD